MRAEPGSSILRRQIILSYLWSTLAVAATTAILIALHHYLDTGQASLLYLPVVIACSIRFGFGPAVLAAILSFLSWDYFFLPPYYTFIVQNWRDWLSLVVFLIAAITTARLASLSERRAAEAQRREAELAILYRVAEGVSREVVEDRLLAALAEEAVANCRASRCVVFRRGKPGSIDVDLALHEMVREEADRSAPYDSELTARVAEEAMKFDQVVGFGASHDLWAKALDQVMTARATEEGAGADAWTTHGPGSEPIGAFVPLRAQDRLVGVLYVGPRVDGAPYSPANERLIHVLANHAAVVIARQNLAAQAAQAEALREADALKEALVSLVSHELRTPLAAIKATASGLLQSDSEWDQRSHREALTSIDREADRLSRVVANLLDLSRLEGGAWRPQKDWCDIGEIIGTVLDRLPPEDAEYVAVSVDDRVPLVRADYTQIALVLTNLLENAAKYGRGSAGSHSLRIDLTVSPEYNGAEEEPQDRPGPAHLSDSLPGGEGRGGVYSLPGGEGRGGADCPASVLISVRDYGQGLLAGEIEHLFTRFFRGRRHRRSEVHGTGLGLALCAAIVRAHGGSIWAENAPTSQPHGAIFRFTLPL